MEGNKRKRLSKTLRFELFKRDEFTCQYCGRKAPDAVLEIDHIVPISKGGDNEITNLITSCFDCNRGKGSKKLSENQTVKTQRKELELLNKRREQLEMISKWRVELLNIRELEINRLVELINLESKLNITVTDVGKQELYKLVERYGFTEVLESSLISFRQYLDLELAFKKIGAIAYMRAKSKEEPYLKDIYYIRAILRNRLDYWDDAKCIELLKNSIKQDIPINVLKNIAITCSSWTKWKETMYSYMDGEY